MTSRELRAWGIAIGALCLAVALQASGPEASGPRLDPTRPPERLAHTGLYLPGQFGTVDPRNHAFAPQYPLWSDGLSKKRWVYVPKGRAIDGTDEHSWKFPVGTRFWKEFSLQGRKVETRFLWKASGGQWIFGSYVWNADGTDARLAPDEGVYGVAEVAPGRRHSIPSRADCAACHGKAGAAAPIGFTALQLSPDRDPGAIHGEPLAPGMLTLESLVAERMLMHSRADLLSRPPRIRTSDPATRSVLGYLSANCAMCHNGNGDISALAPVIRSRDLVTDGDAVARSLIGAVTRWQVPGEPDGTSVLVHPGAPERSAIVARMRSRSPSSQMPPLGTVVRDQAAVDAITRWISAELTRAH